MSRDQKHNENDLNELYNRLKNMDRKKLEEMLEYLDKGSPKLNWLYITLAVAIIFLLIWLIMVLSPDEDVAPTVDTAEDIQLQITDMETRIDELEDQIEILEEANN